MSRSTSRFALPRASTSSRACSAPCCEARNPARITRLLPRPSNRSTPHRSQSQSGLLGSGERTLSLEQRCQRLVENSGLQFRERLGTWADVYKRQPSRWCSDEWLQPAGSSCWPRFGRRTRVLGRCRLGASCSRARFGWRDLASESRTVIAPAASPTACRLARRELSARSRVLSMNPRSTSCPVSYTHLDVYKRQNNGCHTG